MHERLNVDVGNICPALRKLGRKGLVFELDPNTQTNTETSPCFEGGKIVDAVVVSDFYMEKNPLQLRFPVKVANFFPMVLLRQSDEN